MVTILSSQTGVESSCLGSYSMKHITHKYYHWIIIFEFLKHVHTHFILVYEINDTISTDRESNYEPRERHTLGLGIKDFALRRQPTRETLKRSKEQSNETRTTKKTEGTKL